jgi:hypothetical protein
MWTCNVTLHVHICGFCVLRTTFRVESIFILRFEGICFKLDPSLSVTLMPVCNTVRCQNTDDCSTNMPCQQILRILRFKYGEKVGYCYHSGLENTLFKWEIHVPLVMKGLNVAPIRDFIYHLTDNFFGSCPAHPNPLVRSIGNYTLADLHHQYKKYIHKRPKHLLL